MRKASAPSTMSAAVLPATQARSRETVERLLDAAEHVLEERGLEATSVAAVAEQAGMSVGIVYKRFPDKDALLRAVYERFFVRSGESNAAALSSDAWTGQSAETIVDRLVAGMVHGYLQRPGLLRSLLLFAETHGDTTFRDRAEKLRASTFDGIERLLMERRDEMRHGDPRNAVQLGLLVLGLALRGVVLEKRQAGYKLARTGRALATELARMFKAYLGIRPSRN
jgi:AcrR family transcriptional regulator